jgi:hypothetical protein
VFIFSVKRFANELVFRALTAMFLLDVSAVIAKRMKKISKGGPAAAFEAQRMFTEKMFAVGRAGFILATGGSLTKVGKMYRSRVRANKRRLK